MFEILYYSLMILIIVGFPLMGFALCYHPNPRKRDWPDEGYFSPKRK